MLVVSRSVFCVHSWQASRNGYKRTQPRSCLCVWMPWHFVPASSGHSGDTNEFETIEILQCRCDNGRLGTLHTHTQACTVKLMHVADLSAHDPEYCSSRMSCACSRTRSILIRIVPSDVVLWLSNRGIHRSCRDAELKIHECMGMYIECHTRPRRW